MVKCEGATVKSEAVRATQDPVWQHFDTILYRKRLDQPIVVQVWPQITDCKLRILL